MAEMATGAVDAPHEPASTAISRYQPRKGTRITWVKTSTSSGRRGGRLVVRRDERVFAEVCLRGVQRRGRYRTRMMSANVMPGGFVLRSPYASGCYDSGWLLDCPLWFTS